MEMRVETLTQKMVLQFFRSNHLQSRNRNLRKPQRNKPKTLLFVFYAKWDC